MVLPDLLDHKVSKVLEANLENPVLLVHLVLLDQEACPAYLEKMETMVMMVQLGHQVFKVHQDHAVCQVCLGYQELKATEVFQAWMAQREKLVVPVQKVPLDKAVQLALLVPWDPLDQEGREAVKVHLVHQVFGELMVLLDRQVHQVDLVNQDRQASQGQLVQRETKVFKEQKDQPDFRGREVNLVNLVLLVKEVQWVHLVKMEWWERKVLLDHKVILVRQVSLVLVVLLACQVVLVSLEEKETEDSQDREVSRETQV